MFAFTVLQFIVVVVVDDNFGVNFNIVMFIRQMLVTINWGTLLMG